MPADQVLNPTLMRIHDLETRMTALETRMTNETTTEPTPLHERLQSAASGTILNNHGEFWRIPKDRSAVIQRAIEDAATRPLRAEVERLTAENNAIDAERNDLVGDNIVLANRVACLRDKLAAADALRRALGECLTYLSMAKGSSEDHLAYVCGVLERYDAGPREETPMHKCVCSAPPEGDMCDCFIDKAAPGPTEFSPVRELIFRRMDAMFESEDEHGLYKTTDFLDGLEADIYQHFAAPSPDAIDDQWPNLAPAEKIVVPRHSLTLAVRELSPGAVRGAFRRALGIDDSAAPSPDRDGEPGEADPFGEGAPPITWQERMDMWGSDMSMGMANVVERLAFLEEGHAETAMRDWQAIKCAETRMAKIEGRLDEHGEWMNRLYDVLGLIDGNADGEDALTAIRNDIADIERFQKKFRKRERAMQSVLNHIPTLLETINGRLAKLESEREPGAVPTVVTDEMVTAAGERLVVAGYPAHHSAVRSAIAAALKAGGAM